jgi:mercuric ion transport protein
MPLTEHQQVRLGRTGSVAAVLAAFGASLCCIGPVAAALFGLSSLAALARYESLRPAFLLTTFAGLGTAFFLNYRRTPSACEADAECADRIRNSRLFLWIATAAALVIVTFPTWSNWVLA